MKPIQMISGATGAGQNEDHSSTRVDRVVNEWKVTRSYPIPQRSIVEIVAVCSTETRPIFRPGNDE